MLGRVEGVIFFLAMAVALSEAGVIQIACVAEPSQLIEKSGAGRPAPIRRDQRGRIPSSLCH